ncbi:MAG: hypothetical protein LWX83_15585 [Anaerolineae bacterium]|nr:hypothetical protein [Anaerolineae bacterium]
MSEIISQIFGFSFIFLLGVIVGALGEMYFGKRNAAKNSPGTVAAQPPVYQQPEKIPTMGMDVPPPLKTEVNEPEPEPALPPPEEKMRYVSTVKPQVPPAAQPAKNDPKIVQKPLSIAEQVDEILEELQRFSNTSLPPVSLMDDGHQGVLVKVGGDVYPGIEAVPQAEVKELIRRAVQEWERRSSKK